MAMHTLPKTLPGDWLAAFKLPSVNGMYERFIVIHPSNSPHDPFVVHTAGYVDEGDHKGWSYASGSYCRTLDRAQVVWLKQVSRYMPDTVDVMIGEGKEVA